MDEGFLGKIDGPFICLATAILCHSLRCWRTGDFIDNVPFTRANCGGKMNSAYLWFSKVCGSLGAQASGYFRKPQVLNAGNGSANEKTGLLERQIETWNGTEKVWQDRMIQRIRGTLEARIARERGKQVERTAGYSNDEEALRREFGMGPGPGGLESAGGVADERRGIVDTSMALSREPADAPRHTEEPARPRG